MLRGALLDGGRLALRRRSSKASITMRDIARLYDIRHTARGFACPTHPAPQVEGGRPITVYFLAETAASMPWKFTPQQKYVKVVPGETALAFYTAHNPTGEQDK